MPCAAGTQITVSRCNNLSCDPANLTEVGSAPLGDDGSFQVALALEQIKGVRLLFAVVIVEGDSGAGGTGQQTPYRVMNFGPPLGGGHVTDVLVDPSSEAALRLLSEEGLESYSDDAIGSTIAAVRTANAANSFAGQEAAAAVDSAAETSAPRACASPACIPAPMPRKPDCKSAICFSSSMAR